MSNSDLFHMELMYIYQNYKHVTMLHCLKPDAEELDRECAAESWLDFLKVFDSYMDHLRHDRYITQQTACKIAKEEEKLKEPSKKDKIEN